MVSRRIAGGARLIMLGILALSVALAATSTLSAKARPRQTDKRVVGYFIEWGIYGRGYTVKDIVTSGSAPKLTHINYAFGNVAPGPDGKIVCQIGDAWADYQKPWSAEESVDGAAVGWDAPLRGNFQQLRALKALYPNIKIMISLGGWSWSSHFSDAALTAESRATLIKSCVDLFIKGDLPAGDAGGPGAAAGVFDGIDIDWEYPGAAGASNNFRPEDTQNFTALLAEFRSALDALGATTGQHYPLTIATGAGQDKISKLELSKIHQYLDFINVMTYDFHGTWERTTNFNSPLSPSKEDPAYAYRLTTQEAIASYIAGGVPRDKIVVGVPFYGKGWQGVPSTNNGLYQPATGAAPATWEAGTEDYKVLKQKLEAGAFERFFDGKARNAWLYDAESQIFWSFDDPKTMHEKVKFVNKEDLGGVMFWELSGDTAEGELISTLDKFLK